MSSTYSVYKLKIDDSLYFAQGATAGYVMVAEADGKVGFTASVPSGGGTGYRFITKPTFIEKANQQVAYDMFVVDKLTINAGTSSYAFGSKSFNNDGLLQVENELWVDGTIQIDGILIIGK